MAVAVANLDVLDSKMKQNKVVRKRRRVEMNDEVAKRKALKSCFKTVEVARNQLSKHLIAQLKKLYHLELESYEAHSVKFLEIPDTQDMNIWFLVDHLKKYYVVVKQMIQENSGNIEYYESLKSASSHISQLIDILKLTAMLMTGKISPKKGYPTLPDELKTESSRSKRQNRDYIFAKQYKKFLKTIEEVLMNYQ